MFTDIVGYTALTQRNESATIRLLEEHRKLIRPSFASHGGREIKTTGDGFLVEFQSALDALLCAVAIQHMMHDREIARGDTLSLRIGIHIGDVIEKGKDILGDVVNIASRIEPLAEPGGVCVTSQFYEQVRSKSDLPLVSLGEKSLKNVAMPVAVYKVVMPWEKPAAAETAAYPTNRIAILPFASFSPDPNDEYFADGMTEELISTMSKVGGLRVIARTSVMGYKGGQKRVSDVAKELEVGTVLEGSVRKAGDRLRITAQLIDSRTSDHLWAESYDRKLDDVFAVQSEVAKQVAEALRVRILAQEKERIEKRPTESTVAYTLYLKGRHNWGKRGIEYVRRAMEYFELAVHEDPNFALGYVGQADCCLILGTNWGLDREANLEKTSRMAAQALELDPHLAEAHATRGAVLSNECKPRHAEEEFKKAIELKQSYAPARHWYFHLLRSQQRWDEALEQIEKAVELDPLSAVICWNHGSFYFYRGDYGRALEISKKAMGLGTESFDRNIFSYHSVAAIYGKMKMYDEMRQEFAAEVELLRGTYPLIRRAADAQIAYFEDDRQTLRRLLPELEALPETGVEAYSLARYHFFLGENDKGFEWLEKSYSSRDFGLLNFIASDGDFDAVRSDPRYLDLVKRLGLD
jgi:adenylate cyclase